MYMREGHSLYIIVLWTRGDAKKGTMIYSGICVAPRSLLSGLLLSGHLHGPHSQIN